MSSEEEQLTKVSEKLLKSEQIATQWIKRCEQYVPGEPNESKSLEQSVFQIKLVLEILLADCYLMLTVAAFLAQSLSDFAKAAYRLRKSYTLFNQVKSSIQASVYLSKLQNAQHGADGKLNLEKVPPLSVNSSNIFASCIFSGIHFGTGLFELLMSSLPKRARSILSTFGLSSADKNQAIYLLKQSLVYEGLHGPMAALVLTSYYSGIVSFLSHRPSVQTPELQEAKLIISVVRQTFTQSKIWMMMDAKFLKIECKLQEANELLDKALNTKSDTLKELDYLISYDQGWIKMLVGEYEQAIELFNSLQTNTEWSKAFYCYCQACCWLITGKTKEALECFQKIPGLVKKRMGGRVLPIEMYIKQRIEFYAKLIELVQNGSSTIPWDICRVVPLMELMFSFNGFHAMNHEQLQHHLNLFNFEPSTDPKINQYDRDTIILTNLLKGHILREMNQWDESYTYLSQLQQLPPNCQLKNINTFGQFELAVVELFNSIKVDEKSHTEVFDLLADRTSANNNKISDVSIFYKKIESITKLNAQGELEDRLQWRLQWLKDDLDGSSGKN
ncbi:hypothetical protein CONCODRAFT_78478 [Conidiobolus coronatus NRRL 28638]|uniref:TPR-like protein n=1 Tax=Conidiobolus coronatus (strain ATCC 28846 / CBS 209.66 / NRRL 28638) TaxID=796925 RepID=A0A137P842_CONC2|nr:hypothetical protein CONCODRAFT_78478 [Conidiobolus coronatus NRRL 28638]|eukprot:KXN71183.1 hypothetical protein CONCODRAFT_78478 [Conidiobolus coronatus NRRL 28638]